MALTKHADPYDQDLMRDMKLAQERDGVSLTKQVFDFLAVRSSGAGLTFEEYLYFGLHKQARKDYSAYMGNNRARAAFYLANDLKNWNAAEDKLNFHEIVSAAGLPTPKIIAAAHADREMGDVAALRSSEDIRDFLRSCETPIFGKPAVASHGDGAVMIIGREGDQLKTVDGALSDVDVIVDGMQPYMEGEGYLFQEVLQPNETIAEMTGDRLATVRLLALANEESVSIRHAVLRMPAGENRVDNFRRAGNLVAPVDVETGVLGAAVRGIGVAAVQHEQHPDTEAKISGVALPDFIAAKAIVAQAAKLFPTQHIQSWDVALTDQGPSLLEVNPGGNFNVLQLASGRGVFDAEFRDFLKQCVAGNAGGKIKSKGVQGSEEASEALRHLPFWRRCFSQ